MIDFVFFMPFLFISLAIILPILILAALVVWIVRSSRREPEPAPSTDFGRMDEMLSKLTRMEDRIESLETLLVEQERKAG